MPAGCEELSRLKGAVNGLASGLLLWWPAVPQAWEKVSVKDTIGICDLTNTNGICLLFVRIIVLKKESYLYLLVKLELKVVCCRLVLFTV